MVAAHEGIGEVWRMLVPTETRYKPAFATRSAHAVGKCSTSLQTGTNFFARKMGHDTGTRMERCQYPPEKG